MWMCKMFFSAVGHCQPTFEIRYAHNRDSKHNNQHFQRTVIDTSKFPVLVNLKPTVHKTRTSLLLKRPSAEC